MKILVLLSTWNGGRYVREQLASILAQQVNGTLEVLVRDDGSSDGTINIVEGMNDGRIRVIRGKNLGAKGSFMALVGEAARSDADYIALADQDDVWLPGKLQRAVSMLADAQGPLLYCSALNLVDDQLQPLDVYRVLDSVSFESSFLVNCVTGCTCVFNRDLLNLVSVQPDIGQVLMHDWWLYLVVASFGQVVYDQEPLILYRQHSSNQVGMRTGLAALIHRTRQFLKRPSVPSRLTQAREFQRVYGHRLPQAKQHYLGRLVACEGRPFTRLHFALMHRPRRRVFLEDFVSLLTFLVGRT
jgi:glycosyltransferase involved in cell wall biosynthesis